MSDTRPLKARTAGLRLARTLASPRDHLRLQEIFAHKRGGRLLELGFGSGGFLSLAGAHFDSLGLDHSARRVARAHSLMSDFASVMQAEIEAEDFGRGHYDVVAAFNILEHLFKPPKTVRRIHTALKDTGILIGSVPNNQPPVGTLITLLSNICDRTHVATYGPKRWHKIFTEAGFRQVYFFGEVLLSKFLPRYVRDGLWPYYAFNLMFVCTK